MNPSFERKLEVYRLTRNIKRRSFFVQRRQSKKGHFLFIYDKERRFSHVFWLSLRRLFTILYERDRKQTYKEHIFSQLFPLRNYKTQRYIDEDFQQEMYYFIIIKIRIKTSFFKHWKAFQTPLLSHYIPAKTKDEQSKQVSK